MSTRVGTIASGFARHRRIDLASLRDYGIVLTCGALFIALSVSSDVFLTSTNLLNILDQWSALGIMACGMTLVLIAGGFDLSAGAVYALSGVVAAKLANSLGVVPGLALGALAGMAVGIVNGSLVTAGRINPFVATLGTSIIVGGLALAISDGLLITVEKEGFETLGRSELFGAKYSVWLFAVTAVVLGLVLHRTKFGRYIFAAGGNDEALRLSGVRVGLVRAGTYAIIGLAAGLAGVIAASRVSTGQADAGGYDLLFDVFAAVIIGGTSLMGGDGAIWRTLIGLALVAMIGNGFNLLSVDPVYQRILFGTIILFAVAVDAWARRSRS